MVGYGAAHQNENKIKMDVSGNVFFDIVSSLFSHNGHDTKNKFQKCFTLLFRLLFLKCMPYNYIFREPFQNPENKAHIIILLSILTLPTSVLKKAIPFFSKILLQTADIWC